MRGQIGGCFTRQTTEVSCVCVCVCVFVCVCCVCDTRTHTNMYTYIHIHRVRWLIVYVTGALQEEVERRPVKNIHPTTPPYTPTVTCVLRRGGLTRILVRAHHAAA
jgi:hypothetical protein